MTAGTSTAVVTLTRAEHDELRAVAQELAEFPPRRVDAPAWVLAARQRSCLLPLLLRETLREYRHDSGTDGVLLLRNLPIGTAIPPTPTIAGSVEREATVAAAVQVLLSLCVGEIGAFRAEKTGALVQNVVPVPGRERSQSNAGSVVLTMHVENAFHPARPDFVALLCLRADHENRAALLVAPIRPALAALPPPARRILAEPRFRTEPPPSFGGTGGGSEPHPVLCGSAEDPDIRVDFASTRPLDADAGAALAELETALAPVVRRLVLRPGELALVDNRLALHGRTAFIPRYDGRDRWLYRTFVFADGRRTRPFRSPGGYVLT
ncbi:TauD/TfdA family dioxygenase [Amycolatopsis samaneae]|uniref:TauD/TfdA family dioxygenase n=1 Tax=Amycolatopsis samaneae TaxID=664691 RepID=A0ABW5GP68_9PSEU